MIRARRYGPAASSICGIIKIGGVGGVEHERRGSPRGPEGCPHGGVPSRVEIEKWRILPVGGSPTTNRPSGQAVAAVHEELALALRAGRYERQAARHGYRNGVKTRTLTGPAGPMALTLPRATLARADGEQEWASTLVPRY